MTVNPKQVVQDTENRMKKSIDAARREFSEVQIGRAHPGLIEGLHVDYYGTLTLVRELASISIPDPRTVMIQPWDLTVIPELEKAINNSKIGGTTSNDGKIVRISIPPLSKERREDLKKIVKDMAEKSRISLRTIRREANEKIKKLESDKAIPEDAGFKTHEEIQKLTDKFIKEIDHMLDEKGRALTEIN